MQRRGYLRPAFHNAFSNGWWWRSLILIALGLVPVVGWAMMLGYYMLVMRRAALSEGPGLPAFGHAGSWARRAYYGFVVSLIWYAVWSLVCAVVFLVAGGALASTGVLHSVRQVFAFLLVSVGLFALPISIVVKVAVLRTAVCDDPRCGLSVRGVLDMIRRGRSGFWPVAVLTVTLALLGFALAVATSYLLPGVDSSGAGTWALRRGWSIAAATITVPLSLIVYSAYGLWARDTDPPTWPSLDARSDSGLATSAGGR